MVSFDSRYFGKQRIVGYDYSCNRWLVIGQLEYIHNLPSNGSILAQFTIKLDNIRFCVCVCVYLGIVLFVREKERERKEGDRPNQHGLANWTAFFMQLGLLTSRWIVQVQNWVMFLVATFSPLLIEMWLYDLCGDVRHRVIIGWWLVNIDYLYRRPSVTDIVKKEYFIFHLMSWQYSEFQYMTSFLVNRC